MTVTNEFEEKARQEKVDRIASHLLSVHGSLKAEGALGEFSTPWGWARHPRFPFSALVAASGAKPASETTKALVLAELREVA